MTAALAPAPPTARRKPAKGKPKRPAGPPAPSPLYLALIARHPLRPIRDDADYDHAVAVMESVDFREQTGGPPPDADEDAYVAAMAVLIRAYDDEHHPMPDPSTIPLPERLRALMEGRTMNQKQLAEAAGLSPGNVCDVLKGRRGLSKASVRNLAAHFRVPADYLL